MPAAGAGPSAGAGAGAGSIDPRAGTGEAGAAGGSGAGGVVAGEPTDEPPACVTRVDCAIGEACLNDACANPSGGRSFGDEEPRDADYGILPELDVSATGHAAVVWSAGHESELRVSRYILSQGQWTAPLRLHDAMAPFPGSPHIGVDDAGNAVAVWHQGGNEYRDGWANRYDAELNMWLGAQRIEPEGDGFADSLRVVMDGAGNATAVWPFYRETGGGMVRANRYDAASRRWAEAIDVSPQAMTGAGDVTAAADLRGNVMAAWVQQGPAKEFGGAQTARYDVATGTWGAPVEIDAHDLGHANHPAVTADADGNFFVAWHKGGEGNSHVWVNRYDAATSAWGTAEKLDNATRSSGAVWPKLGADHHGNCLAIWQQDSLLMSARYESSSRRWTMLGPVDDAIGPSDPSLAVDPGGNGLALFRGSGQRVYVSRFDAASRTWGGRESIDPVHADRASHPSIDIDAEGRATATWHAIGASRSWEVMTNRFE
jgi:hypothetical protein